jgi:hypothetical protein
MISPFISLKWIGKGDAVLECVDSDSDDDEHCPCWWELVDEHSGKAGSTMGVKISPDSNAESRLGDSILA